MDNPGAFTLGDFTVTTADTQTSDDVLEDGLPDLSGLDAASIQVRAAIGTAGTKINVYLQTSLDQGQSWFDVANIPFTSSSAVQVVNLSGLVASALTPADAALADGAVINGVLGDRLRAKVVSTGTYSGQTLVSVRGIAR